MNIDAIKNARDTIANGYWHKGSARSSLHPERVCAVTALGTEEVIKFVEKFVPFTPKRSSALRPLARFNDDPKTTRQDVMDVLDKALAELGGLG